MFKRFKGKVNLNKMSIFDNDGYKKVTFVGRSSRCAKTRQKECPKELAKVCTKKERANDKTCERVLGSVPEKEIRSQKKSLKEDIRASLKDDVSSESYISDEHSDELSSNGSASQQSAKSNRESIEEDDSCDVTLFAKYVVHESGNSSTRCVQIEIDSGSTIGEMKNAFIDAIGIKKQNTKFYHFSYANAAKFGLGDIRKEDGKVGRFLDPHYDMNLISSQNIENGSMFQIDFPK